MLKTGSIYYEKNDGKDPLRMRETGCKRIIKDGHRKMQRSAMYCKKSLEQYQDKNTTEKWLFPFLFSRNFGGAAVVRDQVLILNGSFIK